MKLFKTIYRYALVGLPFAASVAWTVYCQIALVQQKAYNLSKEFIDLSLRSMKDAVALVERAAQLQQLRNIGLVLSIVLLLVLALMITWQILNARWEKAGKNPVANFFRSLKDKKNQLAEKQQQKKQEQLEQKAKAEAQKAQAQRGFCPNCGTPYDSATGFCTNCGCSLEEK